MNDDPLSPRHTSDRLLRELQAPPPCCYGSPQIERRGDRDRLGPLIPNAHQKAPSYSSSERRAEREGTTNSTGALPGRPTENRCTSPSPARDATASTARRWSPRSRPSSSTVHGKPSQSKRCKTERSVRSICSPGVFSSVVLIAVP